jgi:cob(I)alamin adenosyltransferase
MGTTCTIRLEQNDLGQLLDALRSRSEAWHGTAEHLESGVTPRDDFVIEECSDADEARTIAEDYDRIIATIEAQMNAEEPLA